MVRIDSHDENDKVYIHESVREASIKYGSKNNSDYLNT